jgi:hypothetical protein
MGSLWGVHVYARDFGKNEVAMARYLRGVGFKASIQATVDSTMISRQIRWWIQQ